MICCRSICKKTAFKRSLITLLVLICLTATGGLSGNAWCANLLKIGFLEEPKTLNIWLASDTWSLKVLSQIYQPLYVRDPDTLKLVPWLAQDEPVYDAKTLSYTIQLRPGKWSDGSEFTSEDVAFTGRLIQEFKVPRYLSNWKFIKKIDTPDKHTVRFYLKTPKAIFLTRTLTTPVVQKKEWINILENARKSRTPITKLLNHRIKTPVGMGPFVLKEWRRGAYIFLEKNRYFFGKDREINGRRLGPYIDGIVFKVFGTSDAAIMALRKGSIDMFWWGIQPGYLDELRSEDDIRIFC
ncbi:MAG: ABC transporter substrate-binding protein, partial [Thermodesulfobacteriota bacterium]|nr:ABC transporter substrate-binding protein [Thermodesulfobacteriota bacterium]